MKVACAALIFGLFTTTSYAASPFPTRSQNGVVLALADSKQLLDQCSREEPRGYSGTWTPSAGQARELEAKLPAALRKASADRDVFFRSYIAGLPQDRCAATVRRASIRHTSEYNYVPQYAGFVLSGVTVMYVNGWAKRLVDNPNVPRQFRSDWPQEPEVVCVGGGSFFGAEYTPIEKTLAHFAFNVSLS